MNAANRGLRQAARPNGTKVVLAVKYSYDKLFKNMFNYLYEVQINMD